MHDSPAPPPFDPQAVFGQLTLLLRQLNPGVDSAYVVFTGGGLEGRLGVPLPASDEETVVEDKVPRPSPEVKRLADAIVEALSKLPQGVRRSGADLANDVERLTGDDTDHTLGTFKRAVRHLKAAGHIPDDCTGGYLLNP